MHEVVPFDELLSNVVDNRGRTAPTAEQGVPLIATNCIKLESMYPVFEKVRYVSDDTYQSWFRAHPEPGDILFVTKGSPGRTSLVPNPVDFCIAQDMVAVRANPAKIYPKFLFALLRLESTLAAIEGLHVGTLIPHFKKGDFGRLLLPVPDRSTQELVGDTYFELSEKIELNRQMNQTLDEIARTLFRSWFVDFDPVRAKAEGRQPDGMDAETAALFPDRLVDSELGPIPEGWEWSSVDAVANINRSNLKPSDQWDHIRYIDISSTQAGDILSMAAFERGQEPSRAKRRLSHGDTALSTVRPDRRSYFLALAPSSDLIASTGFAVISPENVPWGFLHAALTQDSLFETLGNLADGGAYPAVRPNVIGQLPVIETKCGPLLDAYQQVAGPLYELAAQNRLETQTHIEIRDALLPELLSGSINGGVNTTGGSA